MMESQKFSWKGRIRSFGFAFNGVACFFRYEHNAWIHGVAAIAVIAAAVTMKLPAMEMIAVVMSIALVWMAEMFNTAIEKIMDHLSPDRHPQVKAIKDLAAAAVLVAAFSAFITGCIIFIPRLL